jgi:hypothetical protein
LYSGSLSYRFLCFKLAFNTWFSDWVNRDEESFRLFLFVPRLLVLVFEFAAWGLNVNTR